MTQGFDIVRDPNLDSQERVKCSHIDEATYIAGYKDPLQQS